MPISFDQLLQKMWAEGVRDKTAVMRHRHALGAIAEKATEMPTLIDYDGKEFLLTWESDGRSLTFSFSQLSGRVQIATNAPMFGIDGRFTSAQAEKAFTWLYQLYKKASNRKRKAAKVASSQ